MQRRIARTIALIFVLAAGLAGAHPTKPRVCGSFRAIDGDPVGVVVQRGVTKCATALKLIRTYLHSDAACEGSACVRKHSGWTCASAKAFDGPRLATCTKGRSSIEAYA